MPHHSELRTILEKKNSRLYGEFERIERIAKEISEYSQLYGDTLNGLTHIKDVESKLNELIPNEKKEEFTACELFMLLCGTYFHDIGKIKGTEGHPLSSKKIILKYYEKMGISNKHLANIIGDIAFGHGNVDIKKLPTNINIADYGNVNIRFITALLRLGDELSLAYIRAPEYIKILLEKENIMIDKWKLRENITGVLIDPKAGTITIQALPMSDDHKAQFTRLRHYIQEKLDEVVDILEERNIVYRRIYLDISCIDDVQKIIRKRGDMYSDEWRSFYGNTKKRLLIMGQSARKIFEEDEDKEIILNILENGINISVLLLNPYENSQQFCEVDKELTQKTLNTKDYDLKGKIEGTLRNISKLNNLSREKKYPGTLMVKVTNEIMYCAISIVDNKMYVNSYSNNPEGDKCPVLLLRKKENEGLFQYYEKEFKRMWKGANPDYS